MGRDCRGVLRGPCKLKGCMCKSFEPVPNFVQPGCFICNHPPAQHEAVHETATARYALLRVAGY